MGVDTTILETKLNSSSSAQRPVIDFPSESNDERFKINTGNWIITIFVAA